MPNHWGHAGRRIISGSSPIATHLPHAVGMALAAKHAERDDVVMCYFGDGAASKGDFHESLNFAGIHRLPIVFVCENNGYAISVPLSKESAVENIAEHAHSYRLTGVIVDGNDPIDVYAATHSAIRHARKGEGAALVECKTYRYLGHTSDDDDRSYRTPAEVELWRKKDPLVAHASVPHRAAPAVRAARGGARGGGQGRGRGRRQPGRGGGRERAGGRVHQGVGPPLGAIPGVPADLAEPSPPRPDQRPPVGPGPERTIVDALRQAQHDLLAADERVMILGEDVGPTRRRLSGDRGAPRRRSGTRG